MRDQRGIMVGLHGDRDLDHDLAALGQRIGAFHQFLEQDVLGRLALVARDRRLGLQDRHQAVRRYLGAHLELLGGDRGDAGLVGQIDHRAHLGTEHAQADGALEQRIEPLDRLHHAHAVGGRLEPLVDLQEGNDAALLPQIGRHRQPVRLAVHRAFEQDRGQHLGAGEGGRRHDTHPHRVHRREHLGIAIIGGFRDAIGLERAGGRSTALVERGDEARTARHLRHHLRITHRISPSRWKKTGARMPLKEERSATAKRPR